MDAFGHFLAALPAMKNPPRRAARGRIVGGASPHPAGRHLRKEVLAMDAQTVIAICALLTVVVAIADLARKE